MLLTGARILIEELIRQGVTTVFGYPGGAVLDIYDELYKNARRITHVLTAHEQGAAHAADGYARVTGRPGVVLATSGPGAANLVTGIANAYLDSVPLVAITGNVAAPLLGKDSFQEVDIIGITQPVVKHNILVREVGELQRAIAEAFAVASSGRRGPVLIDLPKDVQRNTWEYTAARRKSRPASGRLPSLDAALRAIEASERPYIYCGGGVVAANAGEEALALSAKIAAPIGLSMMGLSAVPHSYELNLGMSGMHGRYAASLAQSRADLVIAAGARFNDRATGDINEYARNCAIIHIDIDEAELGKNVPGIIELCGDAKRILAALAGRCRQKRNTAWIRAVLADKRADRDVDENRNGAADGGGASGPRLSPGDVVRTVGRHTEPDTVVATDVGQHQMWVMQHYAFARPRTLLTSGGLGTMGYGLGAAIGGCLASGRKRTILFTGDGSFGMNLNELATAVSQRLPLTIVLFNNGVLGMVRQWQGLFYEGRYAATTLARKTDFVALARAFGADGRVVASVTELRETLEGGLPEDAPFLLDCRIDEDENVYPMIPPGGSVRDIRIG
ncbi:MAG: biosynthetic-type acetolactate synthase large subunit [Deltaproteobacteria bacterium]|jgi:acetolactate synthase-1/2/3 large subunit|nr:biosynthetic-type acetolactate synthase large subunit [Deltaproteobacteria bacterium]